MRNTWNPVWRESLAELQARFVVTVGAVSIDFISDDASDQGRLEAYSATNVLLDTHTTAVLASGAFERMTVSRAAGDIAYVRAFGLVPKPAISTT